MLTVTGESIERQCARHGTGKGSVNVKDMFKMQESKNTFFETEESKNTCTGKST
jgi:hypothetical protein